MSKTKIIRQQVDQVKEGSLNAIDVIGNTGKEIETFLAIPSIFDLSNLVSLNLAHNKIVDVPEDIARLSNLQHLGLCNNYIENISPAINRLKKLRTLNIGMNRLNSLPPNFGGFPELRSLDLSYNNLNETTLCDNLFNCGNLLALYLSDNEIEFLPPAIGRLRNLEILVLRDNDLLELPGEIGQLTRLRELHLNCNRLIVLPPELSILNLCGPSTVVKLENNPLAESIASALAMGLSHLLEYVGSDVYRQIFENEHRGKVQAPPKADRSKKTSKLYRKGI